MTPLFLGIAGQRLSAEETALFRDADPAGYILFARNCAEPDQLRALTDSLRDLAGRALPILIDQEGGRVARLRGPHWPAFPAAAVFGARYQSAPITAITAARSNAEALALMLCDLGITVACLPVLDVRQADADGIVGDRSYGDDAMQVAALGRATLDGLHDGGVVGVVKHLPGHGRAPVDSHVELPVVRASRAALETDLAPFRALNAAPMGMVAHIVYTAFDTGACASCSPVVVAEIIRGAIGFDGLLMSDDIGMAALTGAMAARARAVLDAGCDIALHGSGDFAEMKAIVDRCGAIKDEAVRRLDAAMSWALSGTRPVANRSMVQLLAQRDALLAA